MKRGRECLVLCAVHMLLGKIREAFLFKNSCMIELHLSTASCQGIPDDVVSVAFGDLVTPLSMAWPNSFQTKRGGMS